MFHKLFSPKSCRLWHNVAKYGWLRQADGDSTTRRMHFACWTTNATDRLSEYVTIITCPRQKLLSERVSILHLRTHIAWLAICLTLYAHQTYSLFCRHRHSYTSLCSLYSNCTRTNCRYGTRRPDAHWLEISVRPAKSINFDFRRRESKC